MGNNYCLIVKFTIYKKQVTVSIVQKDSKAKYCCEHIQVGKRNLMSE